MDTASNFNVRSDRSDHHEELVLMFGGIIDSLQSFLLSDVRSMNSWEFRNLVALSVGPMRMMVVVGPRIDKKAALIPSLRVRIVVVVNAISIHNLSDIIRAYTGLIDPDR